MTIVSEESRRLQLWPSGDGGVLQEVAAAMLQETSP